MTANSKPVLHTMVPFSFKDVLPRYKTMQGYHARRKGGWDTHGLPVELQIEKKLGFKSKKEIEEYGIAEFNKLCKESVWEYIGLWKDFTARMGYWADQENPYVTYHNDYIESVWNIVKEIKKQDLLYKDYKVVPWCPRCGTALSSHELAQGYEDVKDLSVYVKFRLKAVPSEVEGKGPSTDSGRADTYLLAWTTTPWTLPGNVALAVGEDIDYVEAKVGSEILVLAKDKLSVLTEPYEIVAEHKGREMVGMEYEHLYPFLKEGVHENEKGKLMKAFKVYPADFVNTEDGTGIVHTAVMYGQDDFVLGTQIGLPKHHLVGLDGKFLAGTGIFEGRFVKDEEVAVDIIKDLASRGLLFKKEKYEHSYPFCWRCHTPLIYYARDSWYIKMSDPKIKQQLISENEKINWEPEYTRDGRFGEWLREIKDWAVSRERYWGTPLPVWECESCKKVHVVGSIEDLKNKTKKSGNKYFVMRHGEAENNLLNVCSSDMDNIDHLTEKGKKQTENSISFLKNQQIDLIFSSPFVRTVETAEIITKELNIPSENAKTDQRLSEMKEGIPNGRPIAESRQHLKNPEDMYDIGFKNGESIMDVKKRVGDFIYEIDKKYKDKKILIISHGGPIISLLSAVHGFDKNKTMGKERELYFSNGEVKNLNFVSIPHNENYELDLHRPYIDEIKLTCDCGGNLVRVKEVMDVWLDSGAMPFAQDHYPFENREW
ncbi:MAG: class I tRNA ligase family protein, partial [Minisyncoccia bacterium]